MTISSNISKRWQTVSRTKPVGTFLKILITLFWLGQLWTTPYYRDQDFAAYNYNPIIRIIDGMLQENTLVGGRFAIYEIVLLLLGFTIMKNHGEGRISDRYAKRFFFISCIVVLISFLNPNNAFDELKYLITSDPRLLLFYIFLLFAFLSVSSRYLGTLMFHFIKFGMIVALAQAALSSVLFVLGSGIFYISSETTLPNAEILNVLIIFSSIALSIYLKTKDTKYLLYVLLFHFTIVFADRRTPVYVLLSADILIFLYYKKISPTALFKMFFIILCLAGFYFFVLSKEKLDFEYHFLRIFSLFSSSYKGEYINDMGHFEQTTRTFNTLMQNLTRFWGAGMRNKYFYVEGQSDYIHNNFAAVWALYGIHMSLFLLYIIGVYARHVLILLKEGIKGQSFPIKAAIASASMVIIIGDAFTGEYFCKHFVYVGIICFSMNSLRLTNENEMGFLAGLSKKNRPMSEFDLNISRSY